MHRRARIYWLTWALLVLGAAATGIASIQDAFFRGAFAAFLAPLALPLYERAGPRVAAFLGLLTGVLWQLGLTYGYGALVWSDTLRAYAMSRLEIDLSVAAAAFAGAALTGAVVHRTQRFAQAATFGTVLALAMTALPYSFIRSSETARLGPIEVTWLTALDDVGEDGRPVRPKGVEVPALSVEDREFLRQAFLVIDVAGETALVDTEGRRLWPVWRKRLHQQGHEDGPVRRVFIAWTGQPEPKLPRRHENTLGAFSLALPEAPDGACAIEHSHAGTKVVAGDAHALGEPLRPEGFLGLTYGNWLERLSDTLLHNDPSLTAGQHRPVFLLLKNARIFKQEETVGPWDSRGSLDRIVALSHGAPFDAPMLWALRREPMETALEACDRPIQPSDRFYLLNIENTWYRRRQPPGTVTYILPDIPAPTQQQSIGNPLDKMPIPKPDSLRGRIPLNCGHPNDELPMLPAETAAK